MTETKHLTIDESDLLAAMEQNFAEHACHLHRHMAGTTVMETDDLLIADSGLDDDSYNIVAAARFTPDTALARITETIRKLAATGRPFSWHLGPASTPADLAAHLEAADLEASETEIAMRKDLSEAPPKPHVDGLDIRPVITPAQLAAYAAIRELGPAVRYCAPLLRRRHRMGTCRKLPGPLPGRLRGRPSSLLRRGLPPRWRRGDLQYRDPRH